MDALTRIIKAAGVVTPNQAMANAAGVAAPPGSPPLPDMGADAAAKGAPQDDAAIKELKVQQAENQRKDKELSKLRNALESEKLKMQQIQMQAQVREQVQKERAEMHKEHLKMQEQMHKERLAMKEQIHAEQEKFRDQMRHEMSALDSRHAQLKADEDSHEANLAKATAAQQAELAQQKSQAMMNIADENAKRYAKYIDDTRAQAEKIYADKEKKFIASHPAVSPSLRYQLDGALAAAKGVSKHRYKTAANNAAQPNPGVVPTPSATTNAAPVASTNVAPVTNAGAYTQGTPSSSFDWKRDVAKARWKDRVNKDQLASDVHHLMGGKGELGIDEMAINIARMKGEADRLRMSDNMDGYRRATNAYRAAERQFNEYKKQLETQAANGDQKAKLELAHYGDLRDKRYDRNGGAGARPGNGWMTSMITGAVAGAGAGALGGSIIPFFGNGVGAIGGALIGAGVGLAGSLGGAAVMDKLTHNTENQYRDDLARIRDSWKDHSAHRTEQEYANKGVRGAIAGVLDYVTPSLVTAASTFEEERRLANAMAKRRGVSPSFWGGDASGNSSAVRDYEEAMRKRSLRESFLGSTYHRLFWPTATAAAFGFKGWKGPAASIGIGVGGGFLHDPSYINESQWGSSINNNTPFMWGPKHSQYNAGGGASYTAPDPYVYGGNQLDAYGRNMAGYPVQWNMSPDAIAMLQGNQGMVRTASVHKGAGLLKKANPNQYMYPHIPQFINMAYQMPENKGLLWKAYDFAKPWLSKFTGLEFDTNQKMMYNTHPVVDPYAFNTHAFKSVNNSKDYLTPFARDLANTYADTTLATGFMPFNSAMPRQSYATRF